MGQNGVPAVTLSGRKIEGDLKRFERPHGDDCDCATCLNQWTRFVAARYVAICGVTEIPGTDLIATRRWHWSDREVQIWRRADRLAYLRALAVVMSEPHKPLDVKCDAKPVVLVA